MQAEPAKSIDRDKLFLGICMALLPTAFSFILVRNILGHLRFIRDYREGGYRVEHLETRRNVT